VPKKLKNFTTEVAEYTEIKMAKSSESTGKAARFPTPPERPNLPKGLSEKDLCALCFLFIYPLVFIPGGANGVGEGISIE
jgi:hypothetical protein